MDETPYQDCGHRYRGRMSEPESDAECLVDSRRDRYVYRGNDEGYQGLIDSSVTIEDWLSRHSQGQILANMPGMVASGGAVLLRDAIALVPGN